MRERERVGKGRVCRTPFVCEGRVRCPTSIFDATLCYNPLVQEEKETGTVCVDDCYDDDAQVHPKEEKYRE